MARRGVNKVILIGNVGDTPTFIEGKGNGGGILNLSIATSESWVDKTTQETVEKTEWHRLAAFNKLAEIMHSFNIAKGSQIWIEGRLQTRKWQDSTGADRYTTEVVINDFQMLGRRAENNGQPAQEQQPAAQSKPAQEEQAAKQSDPEPSQQPSASPVPAGMASDWDDDVPF